MNDPKAARGVIVSARGLEAALVLPNAEGASLCVYDGDREIVRAPMARDADGVLRGVAPGFGAGARYGFRVQGPYDPKRGLPLRPVQIAGRSLRLALRPAVPPPSFDVQVRRGHAAAHAPKAIAGAPPAGEPGHKRIAPGGARHLRAQPARLFAAQPGDPRSCARNLRGARASRVDRASGQARGHRRRDHARRHVCRRAAPTAARPV